MILDQLPNVNVQIAALVLIGLVVGAAINYAIYQWKWFGIKPISPWQFGPWEKHQEQSDEDSKLSSRGILDFIPVVGWLFRGRDSKVLGSGFWFRPMLIELCCAIALPFYYLWHCDNGLVDFAMPMLAPTTTETWFWGHGALIALMVIATFIDFDEKTIPDKVTIPGTLLAILLAAFSPNFRMPETIGPGLWSSLTFCSPNSIPAGNWHHDIGGLAVALGIITIWCVALLPIIQIAEVGIGKFISFGIASVIRPPRTTKCDIRVTNKRGPRLLTKMLAGIWVALFVFVIFAWTSTKGTPQWNSLFGSLVGLGVGGGLVWAVRIVAGYAMGQEAMGFGDVTLMAMIGAFLGWQAAVLTFVLAPFGGLLITIAQFITIRRNEIAFGPYLCGAALLLLLFWNRIWPMASGGFFFLGGKNLAMVGGGALAAMAFMLWFLQLIKQAFGGAEPVDET